MNAKKLIVLAIVVFLGFWMFTDPSGLADTATTAGAGGWALTTELFSGLIDFIGELG